MTKQIFSSKLKYYLFTLKNPPSQGFSLIEIMVAMTILSIAFAINLQFLLLLQIQNLEQKVTTGAVSLTKEILEGTRAKWIDSVGIIPQFRQTPISVTPVINRALKNPGQTTFLLSEARKKDFGGYQYRVVVNICTNEAPDISDDGVVSNCQSNLSSDNRTVIVQVKHPKLIKYEYDANTKQDKATTEEVIFHTERATFTKF